MGVDVDLLFVCQHSSLQKLPNPELSLLTTCAASSACVNSTSAYLVGSQAFVNGVPIMTELPYGR